MGGGFTQSAFTVTSDERQKEDISPIPDNVLDAWGAVDYIQFRLRDRVAEKGDQARLHAGVIAQKIRDEFSKNGIDPFSYGVLGHDKWEATPAEYRTWDSEFDEKGNLVREAGSELIAPAREAGDLFTVRYQEADALSIAWLRRDSARKQRTLDELGDRISALESRVV